MAADRMSSFAFIRVIRGKLRARMFGGDEALRRQA